MKITVHVHPGAAKQKADFQVEHLHVWLNSHPQKGKANQELIKYLKSQLKSIITNPTVHIKSGKTSKTKVLEFNCSLEELKEAING